MGEESHSCLRSAARESHGRARGARTHRQWRVLARVRGACWRGSACAVARFACGSGEWAASHLFGACLLSTNWCAAPMPNERTPDCARRADQGEAGARTGRAAVRGVVWGGAPTAQSVSSSG